MALQLVDLRRGLTDDRWWAPPFGWSVAYENEHWRERQLGDEPGFVQVLEGAVEVARVEFEDPGGINPTYADVPELGPACLEIAFIEVSTAARVCGVGTQLVRALEARHPNRRLFAYSEDDRFLTRVGWEPFCDPSPGPAGRTLFVQRM